MEVNYRYKIFIDTNTFLDFYRVNNKDDVNKILEEIKKYKRFFINTQQSKDEFMRNREKTIDDFLKKLKEQNYSDFNNNFISTLKEYKEYSNAIKKANEKTKEIIGKCQILKQDISSDPIYQVYSASYNLNNFYNRTDLIIDKAIKRKHIGNPPSSNKSTCCDEIIWETLLENCFEDLIIVSRDDTFHKNYSFLKNGYFERNNKQLIIVRTISEAINLNGELPSIELENIENDIIIEIDLSEYGFLQERSSWVNIIYNAILSLGGEANLKDIYKKVDNIISEKYPEKLLNKEREATIRGILQRYSEEQNEKYCLFKKLQRGK